MSNKIIISDMYRKKCKQSFFAMHQIYTKIKNYNQNINIEFHLLWDNVPLTPEDIKWAKLIDDTYGNILYSYNKEFFINYVSFGYSIPKENIIKRLELFTGLYFILMGHYFRRVKMFDYYLIYDDDILINYDFGDVIESCLKKEPVLISEPYHYGCDKSLFQKLVNLFGNEFYEIYKAKHPTSLGINAGFQGMDLSMYDYFLSTNNFIELLNLFDYIKVLDENGNLIVEPYQRTMFETQQQSFFSLCNIVFSRKQPNLLDPITTYVAPNFGYCDSHGTIDSENEFNGWDVCLKSNISHFIGHSIEGKKPIQFLNKVDEYLINNGFNL